MSTAHFTAVAQQYLQSRPSHPPELFEWLEPGQLLAEPPQTWADDWRTASAHTFRTPG